ncbi:MAG: roadblock/LC7 domain-containing protein [Armatimonadetes bacterium]|nr:roadblock/LC7 domain-containing protein [Armatimonadota bacterium]
MATDTSGPAGILRQLRASNPDITAAVVATEDGFPVAADAVPDVNTDLLAALAADLLARSNRSAREFGQGDLSEIYAHGSAGYVIVANAGEGQVLTCLASGSATLGLLLIDVRQTASALAEPAGSGPSSAAPEQPSLGV